MDFKIFLLVAAEENLYIKCLLIFVHQEESVRNTIKIGLKHFGKFIVEEYFGQFLLESGKSTYALDSLA